MPSETMGTLEVDNPWYSPAAPVEQRRIVAVRTFRDDPLGQMHSRKQVSESQYRAGRQFQATYEASGIGKIKPQDMSREPVDCGGRHPEGITDRQLKADRLLDRYERLLGDEGFQLVCAVLLDKMTLRQVADVSDKMPGKATTTFLGHRFRGCLSAMAKRMGYATQE